MSKKLTINVLLLSMTIITLLFNSSCSSKKGITSSELKSYSANQIIREIKKNQFEFENMQSKLNIEFDDGKKAMSLKGQLRMQRDSVIWISLTYLGIEAARLKITTDSINFINRSNKTYLSEDMAKLKEFIPIEPSLEFIQDILTGNERLIQKGERFKASVADGRYRLETRNDDNNFIRNKEIWVLPENFRISKYEIQEQDAERSKIELEYDNFESYNGRYLPTKILLTHGQEISIEIEYSNVTTDKNLKFPFRLNKKYDRINIW